MADAKRRRRDQGEFFARRLRPLPGDTASMARARSLYQKGGELFRVPIYKGGGTEVVQFHDRLAPAVPLWRVEYDLLFADEKQEVIDAIRMGNAEPFFYYLSQHGPRFLAQMLGEEEVVETLVAWWLTKNDPYPRVGQGGKKASRRNLR